MIRFFFVITCGGCLGLRVEYALVHFSPPDVRAIGHILDLGVFGKRNRRMES